MYCRALAWLSLPQQHQHQQQQPQQPGHNTTQQPEPSASPRAAPHAGGAPSLPLVAAAGALAGAALSIVLAPVELLKVRVPVPVSKGLVRQHGCVRWGEGTVTHACVAPGLQGHRLARD